nr:GNAT family N-acetyltransferase [Ameyamaea chiangmaiensis]
MAAIHALCFPETDRWDEAAMSTLLGMPGTFAVLESGSADDPAAVRGFVMARQVLDEAEVLTLAVLPSCRRQGIASALLARLAVDCRGRGAGRLFLEVSEANTAARALYEGCGFAGIGRRRAYYADGSDARVLARSLTD